MRTRLKRFFYVTSRNSRRLHLLPGRRTEGEPVLCGVRIRLGWHWYRKRTGEAKKPLCKRCLKAAG